MQKVLRAANTAILRERMGNWGGRPSATIRDDLLVASGVEYVLDLFDKFASKDAGSEKPTGG